MRSLISGETPARAEMPQVVQIVHHPDRPHGTGRSPFMQPGAWHARRRLVAVIALVACVLADGHTASATDYNADYQHTITVGECPLSYGGVALLLSNTMGGTVTPTGYYIGAPWQAYKPSPGTCSSGTLVSWACQDAPCVQQQLCIQPNDPIHIGVSVAESSVEAASAFLYNNVASNVDCWNTTNLPGVNPCASMYDPCFLPAMPRTARIAVDPVRYELLGAMRWQVHTDGKTLIVRNTITFPANACNGTVCIGKVRFEYYTEHQPLSLLNATGGRQPFQVDTVAGGPVACGDSLVIRNEQGSQLARRAQALLPNAIAQPPSGARFVVVNTTADTVPDCDSPTATQIWLEEVIVGPNEHLITVIAGSHGAVDPGGPVVVADGASQTFTITPDAGHVVADVLVDGNSVGPVASYTFTNVTTSHTIAVSFSPVKTRPDCGQATAVPSELWPPNHKLVPVNITGIRDPDGDRVTVTVTRVTQDEPLDDHDSDGCGNAVVDRSGRVQLRAERAGSGNGRVYTVWFTASDGSDSCVGSVKVCVPHDKAHLTCDDDGLNVNVLSHCGMHKRDRAGKRESLAGVALAGTTVVGNTATLEYSLAAPGLVRINVYDIAGRRVATVEDAPRSEGIHKAVWSTANLARGMYFYRLQVESATTAKAFLILR